MKRAVKKVFLSGVQSFTAVLAVAVFAVLTAIFLFSGALASFSLGAIGNNSLGYSIDNEYGPGASLSGILNLALEDEPADSALKACFSSSDTGDTSSCSETALAGFLEAAGAEYSCSIADCGEAYSAADTGTATPAPLSISSGQEKVVGMKIISEGDEGIGSISDFSLNILSDAAASCSNPLKIDILADGSYEWTADKGVGGQFCETENNGYGCYDASRKSANDALIAADAEYCNKISIEPAPSIKIGATLAGVASGINFEMKIFDEGDEHYETCDIEGVSGAGEYGCVANLSTTTKQNFYICISAKDADSDGGKYKIGTEAVNPCGYAGEIGGVKKDFAIFGRPAKFDAIGSFTLGSEDITGYISEAFEGVDCSAAVGGCLLPIKFIAGANQKITLANANLVYDSGGLSTDEDKIYSVSKEPSLITMEETGLSLADAGLEVPTTYGEHTFTLSLGGENIVENYDITIIEAPVITGVYPLKAPAAINTLFRINVFDSNITGYTWDFGDESPEQETEGNKLAHKYSSAGEYTLAVSATNLLGKSVKSYTINVVSPAEYTGFILAENQKRIESMRAKIASAPSWVKTYLESKISLNSLEVELNKLKTQYEGAGDANASAESIIDSIEALNIPTSLEIVPLSSEQFLIDRSFVDFANLGALGAGKLDASYSAESYKDALFEWFISSMNVLAEETTYSIKTDGTSQPLASKIRLTVEPRESADLSNVYLVVNEAQGSIGFEDSSLQVKPVGTASGIVFANLGSQKIEFILPGEVRILDIPAYFSPPISVLSQYLAAGDIDICNNNNACDKSAGEDWKNCRHDCKPWGLIMLWLFILLFIALCVYLVLQEWYKHRYEKMLFKEENDLYNLINFIDNAEKQGIMKEEMFKRLSEKEWSREQMVYAWRKYKGLRTGMWEIPIFKVFENMKVSREISKRRAEGRTGALAPIPSSPSPGFAPKATDISSKFHLFKKRGNHGNQNKQNINKGE